MFKEGDLRSILRRRSLTFWPLSVGISPVVRRGTHEELKRKDQLILSMEFYIIVESRIIAKLEIAKNQ